MRVLITGGAGFIGSHIVREALVRGYNVRVLDNLSTGHLENLADVDRDVELIIGDIRDSDCVMSAMKGVEVVFHQAALPSVPRSVQDPISTVDVNVMGTAIVLTAAVRAGVRRVVFAASSSAYGNAPEAKKSEALLPHPLSPYAASKLAGEYLLHAFSSCYPIETVGLRYFNVFGERQDPISQYSGVIAKFTSVMLDGKRPVINGDGTISRDFTYVSNVVDANFLAATAPSRVSGTVYNVACGHSISLTELVQQLNEIIGTDIEPIYGPARPGDIHSSCADISLARRELGYEPTVGFSEGLERTVEWYRRSRDSASQSMLRHTR